LLQKEEVEQQTGKLVQLAGCQQSSQTIEPDMNLFSVAQLFFASPYRRFPVLEVDRLIGQLSRCDVLRATLTMFK
jgi:CBS domain